MNGTFTSAEFPPSLVDWPILTMLSIVALMFGMLILLQWVHRIVNSMIDQPHPLRSPVTIDRIVKLLLVLGPFIILLPRLIQVTAWSALTPIQREALSVEAWRVTIIWAFFFAIGWYLDRLAAPAATLQLARFPIPKPPELEMPNKKRGVLMLALVILLAFGITYIRPAQPYAYQHAHTR